MHTEYAEEDLHALLPDNPFVPPKGDICLINNLPPELLSRIFEIGAADNDSEDDDDDEDQMADYWDDFIRHLQVKDAHDSDVDTKELEDQDGTEDEDEDETEDESDSDATGSSDFSPPWPPFEIVVSHVCRHWRNVAFSTPSLWTTIEVGPNDRPPYESVSTLLERSKGLPIDICINCDPSDFECHDDDDLPDYDPPSDADLKFLCSLLVPHIHRWRALKVEVTEYRHMYVFLTAVSNPSISAAPQLTTLELFHCDDIPEDFDNFGYPSMSKHLTLFGGSAPCLESVVLWGIHVDWDQPWIASAPQLANLDLSYHTEDVRPSWVQFASILRNATALEKLGLRMSGPLGDPLDWFIEPTPGNSNIADLNGPIQLLKLSDFVLAFHPPVHVIGLLRRLYLPALKNLELDFEEGDYTDFVHELAGPATSLSSTPAQERSHSLLNRLDSLKIAGLPCRNECLEKLYGQLYNLTALNISLMFLPSSYLEILGTNCSSTGEMWLPRLVTLFVSGIEGVAIRKVVEKRREAGIPLEALYVEESCAVTEEDEEWLKKNLKTFEFFEGSDDEDEDEDEDEEDEDADFEDSYEDFDDWDDVE